MTDYDKQYKAFCINDKMKIDFSDYSVGVEVLNLSTGIKSETILIDKDRTSVIRKEDNRA